VQNLIQMDCVVSCVNTGAIKSVSIRLADNLILQICSVQGLARKLAPDLFCTVHFLFKTSALKSIKIATAR